ncbi:MAG: hypothetical protein HY901_19275 [Deltaproteobacteria bacterium]|nr:hypothetical protein [Deltaproteobacteria bacterium]
MTSLLLALALAANVRVADSNPYLEEARKQYQTLDYEKTLDLLKKAMSWSGTTSAELAEVHLFRGLCNLQLGREGSGRAAFRAALLADPGLQLPPMTSPKIRQFFRAEADLLAAQTASVSAPEPASSPSEATSAAHSPDAPVAARPPAPLTSPAASPHGSSLPAQLPLASTPAEPAMTATRERTRWPAFATLGVAVAAAAVGGAFGYQANDLAGQSGDAVYADDHVRLNERARDKARVANGLYGAAAGLAVLGGVFFFVF